MTSDEMTDRKQPLSGGAWSNRRDVCRRVRQGMLLTWQDSVAYRRGKPFRKTPNEDTVNVPADWSRTKNKQAQLFYQVPEVKLKARRPEFASATTVFAAALNFELTTKVKAEHAMNEALSDVINAAGVAIVKVGYEATFEDKPIAEALGSFGQPPIPPTPVPPTQPQQSLMGAPQPSTPELGGGLPGMGMPPPEMPNPLAGMDPAALGLPETVPMPVYECYYARRISPAHFLWPVEWRGSDWQQAPWLGYDAYMPLAEAQRLGWVDADFEGTTIADPDWFLSQEWQEEYQTADAYVKYSEIFYRAAVYDKNEKDFRKIKRIVLVDGKKAEDAVVVNEDFKWQRYVPETRNWVGLTTFPIKVLTITNISDMSIPPSDSEIGRPQVRELIKGRSQMMRQREHNVPLRWFDTTGLDPVIADKMRKGKWLDMIPTNGPGDKVIGEVAKGQFPRETFQFDQVAKQDLDDAWSMGGPQQGSEATKADTTATEVRTASAALNVRLDYERSWVLRFFLEIAQGIGSLMQLFSDNEDFVEIVGEDGVKKMQAWNKDQIQGEFIFEAKPDSQLRLDQNQQRTEGLNLYKLLRKDPLVNPTELVKQLLEVHGLDPSTGMVPPQDPKPPAPKLAFSFKGEDLLNPIALSVMLKSGFEIKPSDLQEAQNLLNAATGMAGAVAVPEPGVPTPEPKPVAPTGATPPHGGPAPVVEPIGQRYNQGAESAAATGGEGKE